MGAVDSADFLGQKKVTKRSWGYSNGMMTRNYHEQEVFRFNRNDTFAGVS
jgi:hypothetical protein